MQLASSDAAAVLFFLYKGKEKNGSAKKAGDQWSPLRFESEYDRIRRGSVSHPASPRQTQKEWKYSLICDNIKQYMTMGAGDAPRRSEGDV